MKLESDVQTRILAALGSHPEIRMFRNPVGSGFVGVPPDRLRRVTFGLAPGSADLIGLRSYFIRPEDVGKRVALFVSCEVKRPKRSKTADNQILWQDMVEDFGGIALIASDPEQALLAVSKWKPE